MDTRTDKGGTMPRATMSFRSHQRDAFNAALAEVARYPGWRISVDTDERGETVATVYHDAQRVAP